MKTFSERGRLMVKCEISIGDSVSTMSIQDIREVAFLVPNIIVPCLQAQGFSMDEIMEGFANFLDDSGYCDECLDEFCDGCTDCDCTE